MAEIVRKNHAVCLECGADVRDGTQFCYACGKPVLKDATPDAVVEAEDPSEAKETIDSKTEKSEKLASAAAERKKSRIGQRKPKQVVWEEPGASSTRIYALLCVLIFVLSAGVVFLTVFIK